MVFKFVVNRPVVREWGSTFKNGHKNWVHQRWFQGNLSISRVPGILVGCQLVPVLPESEDEEESLTKPARSPGNPNKVADQLRKNIHVQDSLDPFLQDKNS